MSIFRSRLPRREMWCCPQRMPVAVVPGLTMALARRNPPRPLYPVDLPFGAVVEPAPPCPPAVVPVVVGDYPPDKVVRPGDILANPSGWLPPGYLVCDGSEVKIHDYPMLYRILGDYYSNEGDAERGVFHLPKMENPERPLVMYMIKYDLWEHSYCPPPPCSGEPMPAPPATMGIQILPYPTPYTPPPGTILQTTVNFVPYGYLLCDGREVSRDDYMQLYLAIGLFYTLDQSTDSPMFNLPNLKNCENPSIKYIIRYDTPENIVIEVNPNMVMNNMSLSGAGSIEIV